MNYSLQNMRVSPIIPVLQACQKVFYLLRPLEQRLRMRVPVNLCKRAHTIYQIRLNVEWRRTKSNEESRNPYDLKLHHKNERP